MEAMMMNFTMSTALTMNSSISLQSVTERDTELCGYSEECGLVRFIYVMLGTVVAISGCFFNVILIIVFVKKTKSATPPTLYPTVLAMLDALICFFYVLLFGVDAAAIYLHHEALFRIYHVYVVPAFVASKITQFAIPYMLIFATLERLIWISDDLRNRHFLTMRGRHITLFLTLFICVMLRIPCYFALYVKKYERCSEIVRSLAVEPCQWALESDFYYFYDFHAIVFLQTFLPFFLLVALNVIIVERLKRGDDEMKKTSTNKHIQRALPVTIILHEATMRQLRRIRRTRSVRNAVYTMFAIVTSYLVCNSLHLILTIMERSNSSLLVMEDDETLASPLHTILGDTISLLYMFTSTIRIAIYAKCNLTVRQKIRNVLLSSCRRVQAVVKPN